MRDPPRPISTSTSRAQGRRWAQSSGGGCQLALAVMVAALMTSASDARLPGCPDVGLRLVQQQRDGDLLDAGENSQNGSHAKRPDRYAEQQQKEADGDGPDGQLDEPRVIARQLTELQNADDGRQHRAGAHRCQGRQFLPDEIRPEHDDRDRYRRIGGRIRHQSNLAPNSVGPPVSRATAPSAASLANEAVSSHKNKACSSTSARQIMTGAAIRRKPVSRFAGVNRRVPLGWSSFTAETRPEGDCGRKALTMAGLSVFRRRPAEGRGHRFDPLVAPEPMRESSAHRHRSGTGTLP